MIKRFVFIGLLAAATGIMACSQQDEALTESSEVKKDPGEHPYGFADPDLARLNGSILQLQAGMGTPQGQTRGINFDKWLTVLRDILGMWRGDQYYGTASYATGTLASLFSFKDLFRTDYPTPSVSYSPFNSGAGTDSVIVEHNTSPAYVDSMGYYHNAILLEAYSQYGDSLFTMSQPATIDAVSDVASAFTGSVLTSTQKGEVSKFLDNLREASEEASSFNDFCARVKAKYPGDADQITVLQSYVSGLRLALTPAAKRTYTQQVLVQIKTQVTDAAVRKALRAGVNTGFASDMLWNM